MDDLFEREEIMNEKAIECYKSILNNIHFKIKNTAKLINNNKTMFCTIPQFKFGVYRYNFEDCLKYIIDSLIDNGFMVKYFKPNILFIVWKHYYSYTTRKKILKEHGIEIDQFGNIIKNHKELKMRENKKQNVMNFLETKNVNINKNKNTPHITKIKLKEKDSDYKDTDEYKSKGILNNFLK